MHLSAMYDLYNKLYVDARVEPGRLQNEKKALAGMVSRSSIDGNVIVVGDRYYESYNIFAHIEKRGWNYVIRVKDINSNGICSGLKLPSEGEFDVCLRKIFTRRNTIRVKSNPEAYRLLAGNQPFDHLDKENHYFPMVFRVVRIRIGEDSYETLITNLGYEHFSSEEIREIYRLRWGSAVLLRKTDLRSPAFLPVHIETSFRELKYAIGLANFHSKKQEFVTQEIFARLIMYNFAAMITMHVAAAHADAKPKKQQTKHAYQINFTVAVRICRNFLRLAHDRYMHPPDIEKLIRKNILPIRPNRKYPRAPRPKPVVSFMYRVA